MRTFKNQAAQGDCLIRRIDKIPAGANLKEVSVENGILPIAHSETGHHHAFQALNGIQFFQDTTNPLIGFLTIKEGLKDVVLQHFKSGPDAHEAIQFDAGTYEIRRQREHTPDGWRQVQD